MYNCCGQLKTEVKPYPRVNSAWKKKIKEFKIEIPINYGVLKKLMLFYAIMQIISILLKKLKFNYNKINRMKSLKRTSVVLMTALFLTSMFPQEVNAGHKKKYGHSWVSCMWNDTRIVVFGYVIKDSNPYKH